VANPYPCRCGECSLDSPTETCQSARQCLVLDSKSLTPFGQAERLTAKRNQTILPRVALLHQERCPSHIAWFIAALIVDAIQRMLCGRLLSDLSIERHEVGAPRIAHRDAPPAVSSERAIAWIVAAFARLPPRLIFTRLRESVLALISATTAVRTQPLLGIAWRVQTSALVAGTRFGQSIRSHAAPPSMRSGVVRSAAVFPHYGAPLIVPRQDLIRRAR